MQESPLFCKIEYSWGGETSGYYKIVAFLDNAVVTVQHDGRLSKENYGNVVLVSAQEYVDNYKDYN